MTQFNDEIIIIYVWRLCMHDQKFTQGTTNNTFPYESSTSDTVRHLINCTGSNDIRDIPED